MIGTTKNISKNCFRKLYGMLCLDVRLSRYRRLKIKTVKSEHFCDFQYKHLTTLLWGVQVSLSGLPGYLEGYDGLNKRPSVSQIDAVKRV